MVADSAEIQIVVTAFLQDPTIPPDVEEWNRFFHSAVPQNLRDTDIEIEPHSLVNAWSALLRFSVPLPVFSTLKTIGPLRYLSVAQSSNSFLRPTVSSAINPPPEGEYRPRAPTGVEIRPCRPPTPAGGRPPFLAELLRRQPANEDATRGGTSEE
ncbi:hypothetical protein FN846DRAFT_1009390 [Sphaerosporella brunnea]|uniref:Uncharacterized protein n=1 Tax=Sphaerosporella brunnea TaxID=1250544 RepID=A0A5J5FB20_9PEZI|nr:hypothetical protein FN846DRAFT_1009390 [Sphaerosporella brunnea]